MENNISLFEHVIKFLSQVFDVSVVKIIKLDLLKSVVKLRTVLVVIF